MRLLALHTELTLGMSGARYRTAMVRILGPGCTPGLINQGIYVHAASPHLGQTERYIYRLRDTPTFFAWAEATGAFTKEELMELEPLVVLELAGG